MWEKEVLHLIHMLTAVPLRVYSLQWEMTMLFANVRKSENEYERKVMCRLREKLAEQKVAAVFYHPELPIGIWGIEGEHGYCVLGPLVYGSMEFFEGRMFMHQHKLSDYPECRLDNVKNILRFLAAQEDRDFEETECINPEYFELKNLDLQQTINEKIRQIDAFQENHTYQDEQLLYDYVRTGDAEYLKKHTEEIFLKRPMLLKDMKKMKSIWRSLEYLWRRDLP